MKKIATLSLSFVVLAVTLFSFFTAYPKAQAEDFSTITSEATVLSSGTFKYINWTKDNCEKAFYNTINLQSRSYIVLTALKPVLANNEYGAYVITFYNENGDVVWKTDTTSQMGMTTNSYSYTIGLDKGTYYMGIEAKFLLTQGSVSSRYRYVAYSSNCWEIEGNDSKENATNISFNSTYKGVFAEQTNDTPCCDYYAVALEKGYNYKVNLTNYSTLISEDAGILFELISPSGKVTALTAENGTISGAITYWEFTALETGTYYLKLSGSCNKIGYTYNLSVVPFTVSASKVNVTLPKAEFPCSGDEIKPALSVTYGDTLLEEGVQYTVKYPIAVNVGSYNITLTFQNGYSGQRTVPFKIIPPIDVSELDVSLSTAVFEYDGTAKLPDVVAKYGEETLIKDVHYTVTYPEAVNPGDYTATVTFQKGYTGTASLTYTVLPPIDVSELDVSLSASAFEYDGTAKLPDVIAKHGDVTLEKDTHYTVTYPNGCIEPGDYTVTVAFRGRYTGECTLTYKINPIDVDTLNVSLLTTSYTYDGNEKTPTVVAKDGNTTLKKDTHYTVTYPSARIIPGDYTVTVAFRGRYTGRRSLNYKIDPVDVSALSVNLSTTSYTYDGTEKAPSVIAKHGDVELKKDTHYTVTYSSTRINPGSHDVTVNFKGCYKGTKKLSFEIVNATTENSSSITATSTTGSIKLTWPKVKKAAGYMVYQYNPIKNQYYPIANVRKTNHTISRLMPGTAYKFKVVAYQTHFYGNKSHVLSTEEILTATKCAAPKITSATPTDSTITLTWTNVKGATGYKVYQYSPSKHKYVEVASVKDTTYTKTENFKSNSAYKFKVAAYQELANGTIVIGTESKHFDVSTKCAAPKITKIETTESTIAFTWNKVEGATGYKVYQYNPSEHKYVEVASVKDTTYKEAENLKSGSVYSFKVAAYQELANGTIVMGTESKPFDAATKCVAPKITSAAPTDSTIRLNWTKVEGATGYKVYQYSPSKGKYVEVASVKNTTYKKTKNFKSGSAYKFIVAAYRKLANGTIVIGTESEPFDASTKCAAPKITKIETTKNTITLTWNKVEGATGYKVFQYSPSKGKYVLIATVKQTSYKKTKNLKPGTTYKFKVNAYTEFSEEKTLEGVTTKEFKATTKCTPPKIKNYKPSAGQKATIKWSAIAGATGYQVYYSTDNSNYKKAFSTTSEEGTKTFTPSAKGKTIYFKVRAYTKVDGKTVYGEWSEVKSLVVK